MYHSPEFANRRWLKGRGTHQFLRTIKARKIKFVIVGKQWISLYWAEMLTFTQTRSLQCVIKLDEFIHLDLRTSNLHVHLWPFCKYSLNVILVVVTKVANGFDP